MANSKKIKVNDRVKRANMPGCHGVVKDIRSEVTASNAEDKEKTLMAQVLWDNGTLSYMGPESLEVVKE